ncbi:MAG: hypothetical protein JKY61_04860 [Planctomycetes bacterium]|nr:hypothetical protein [Planctomycetota bacterium]
MDETQETPGETERRLRGVLRAAKRKDFAGTWHYQEFTAAQFSGAVRADALALVGGGAGWLQLVPVAEGETTEEPMRLWTFSFDPRVPNSGSVGGLASTIKQRTGAGVIVVCGDSAELGGDFDHWGCPAAVGDEVLAVLEELSTPSQSGALSLDGCLMNATLTAANGVIDSDTIFNFRQQGEQVWADYSGGKLAAGFLVGTLRGSEFAFRFSSRSTRTNSTVARQIARSNDWMMGVCRSARILSGSPKREQE